MTSPAELANQVRAGLEDYGYDDMPHGPAVDRKECHAALSVLEARLEQAEKALEFYADRDHWTQLTSWGGRIHDDESRAIQDHGRKARTALARGVVGETSGDEA